MKKVLIKIEQLAKHIEKDINLMEVCGTHTQAISRSGIRQLMPKNIHLTTGPGCPVCVTGQKDIDSIVKLAIEGVPVATYGDMIRVPGYFGSLEEARQKGAQVFDIYSVDEAIKLLSNYPDLVFFGLGFETTAPMTAFAIKQGLSVYSTHKLFIPAMKALLDIGELKIDGFISPGHVSVIVGTEPYKSMNVPQVIAGFEAEDVLIAIYMLLRQIAENRSETENEYLRAVKKEGNPKALKEIFDVFEVSCANWRGFGEIPESGLEIKERYKKLNAKQKYHEILNSIAFPSPQNNPCICDEIIRGLKTPSECPIYKKTCFPDNPFGPCMVSVEGACNVQYRYN